MKGLFAKRALACGLSVILASALTPTFAFANSDVPLGDSFESSINGSAANAANNPSANAVNAVVGNTSINSTDSSSSDDEFDQLLLAYFALQAVSDSTQGALSLDAQDAREATIPISDIEDFKNIANNPTGVYELTDDISFAGYTHSNSCIVGGTFSGKLYGGGHTISGLYGYALFENLSEATIEGVNFERMTNVMDEPENGSKTARACILTVMSHSSTFRDLSFDNATVAGHDYCGIVTGVDSGSTFEKITVAGHVDIYSGGEESGMFAGVLDSSIVSNIHLRGDITVAGNNNGMLAGVIRGGNIKNVLIWSNYSVNMRANSAGYTNGVFAGEVAGYEPIIHDCVIMGEVNTNTSAAQTYAFARVEESLLGLIRDILVSDTLGVDSLYSNGRIAGSDRIRTFNLERDVQADDATARRFYRGLGFSGSAWSYDSAASSFQLRHFTNPSCKITSKIDYANELLTFEVTGNLSDLTLLTPENNTRELENPVKLTEYLNDISWDRAFTVSCLYEQPGEGNLMAEYTVKVPHRTDAPVVTSTSQPESAGAKGKIVLQSEGKYDIRNADDPNAQWQDIDVSSDLSIEVDPGKHQIRTHYYFGKYFASQPVEATVKPFDAPSGDVRYKVTLNTNGGTVNSGAITDYEAGVGAQLPTDVVRSGYTFAGWFSDPNFADGTQVASISMSDSGDKTFYAKWVSASTRVNFVKVYGATAQTDGSGYSVTIPTKPESAAVLERNTEVSLADPGATYEWRILSGWESYVVVAHVTIGVTAADGVTKTDYPLKVYFGDQQGTQPPDSSNSFSISYECNGGSIESGFVDNYTEGVAVNLPNNVKRENYTFMGWYDNAQFAGDPVESIDAGATGDKTFYAKWLSCKVGFTSVKVNGQAGSFYDCAATVVLPVGSEIPSDPSKVEFTLVDGATAGELTTIDGGRNWKFTCTAEDGITVSNCGIAVSVAKTQEEMDMADVMAATSVIYNEVTGMKTSPELQRVKSKEDLEKWLDESIAGLDLPSDMTIEREVVQFVAAIDGTADRPQGVDGYYKYTIVVSKGSSSGSIEGDPILRDGEGAGEAGDEGAEGEDAGEGDFDGNAASPAHPASILVSASYLLNDESASAGKIGADDEAAGVAGGSTGEAAGDDSGIVILADSDDLPVTTAVDLQKQENPKKLVVDGQLEATYYGMQPPLRDVVTATGDPNANLPNTGDSMGIELATALLLVAMLAACGAACAFRRRTQ